MYGESREFALFSAVYCSFNNCMNLIVQRDKEHDNDSTIAESATSSSVTEVMSVILCY